MNTERNNDFEYFLTLSPKQSTPKQVTDSRTPVQSRLDWLKCKRTHAVQLMYSDTYPKISSLTLMTTRAYYLQKLDKGPKETRKLKPANRKEARTSKSRLKTDNKGTLPLASPDRSNSGSPDTRALFQMVSTRAGQFPKTKTKQLRNCLSTQPGYMHA